MERALISVYDKTGIVDFARGLHERGLEILSTGGTARALKEAGIPVTDVSDFTGFPEMLDGRVKTLHPKVHAGLLFRRDLPEHRDTMRAHHLQPIDLVCVNLYPFEQTVARPDVSFEEAIEQIDIGGPTMLRSAAKNMKDVTVVVDPDDYTPVLDGMDANNGETTEPLRRRLALKVFARTAAYNAAIAGYLAARENEESQPLILSCPVGEPLRYGENPHQSAILYRESNDEEADIAHAEVLHGKAMSYNNYVDGHAALEAVKELADTPAATVIKHTNPCGAATGESLAEALAAAWDGDPVSAFGSVIAVTRTVDLAAVEVLKGRFVEALIAPGFDDDALEWLTNKSKNIRLIRTRHPIAAARPGREIKHINGGLLVQDRDVSSIQDWQCPTRIEFPADKKDLAMFGVKICKHVKSNAILLVYARAPGQFAVLGMGAGQPNRVDAVRKLALTKARENIALLHEARGESIPLAEFEQQMLSSAILISDAFFPFPDNIDEAAASHIRYIVQPGGSKRDDEVIAACDRCGAAMALTGMRHFKH